MDVKMANSRELCGQKEGMQQVTPEFQRAAVLSPNIIICDSQINKSMASGV